MPVVRLSTIRKKNQEVPTQVVVDSNGLARVVGLVVIWCFERKEKVAACWFGGIKDKYFQFFIVTQQERFDFQLHEELVAFEADLRKKGFRLELTQIPATEPENYTAYFNPTTSELIFDAQSTTA